jgi:hypothetical protein
MEGGKLDRFWGNLRKIIRSAGLSHSLGYHGFERNIKYGFAVSFDESDVIGKKYQHAEPK